MTKTALANRERQTKEKIAKMQDERARIEGIKNRGVEVATAAIGALGRLGSASIKGGKSFAAKDAARMNSIEHSINPISRKYNSPDWYKRVPELVGVNTNIPGFYPNGLPIRGAYDTSGQGRLPQVGVIYFSNTFGPTKNTDGTNGPNSSTTLNLAAQRFMTELRKYNSRIGEYEPGDLLQFTIAGVEIFTFIARLGRAIQSYHYFNEYNPNIRETMLAFMGFQLTEFSDHIKEYEKLYMTMLAEANRILTVPSDMTYLHRKLMLSSNIYIEGKGHNAQVIFTQPIEGYIYNEANAALRPFYLGSSNSWWNLASYRNQFQLMLDQLQNSSFCTTLMADIRSAQGLELFQLQPIDTSKVDISEITEVLTQLMNAELPPIFGNNYNTSTAVNSADVDRLTVGGTVSSNIRTYTLNSPVSIINNLLTARAAGTTELFRHLYLNQDTNGFLVQTHSINGTTNEDYKIHLGHSNTANDITASDRAVVVLNNQVKLFNFYNNDINADDILVASRFTTSWYAGSDDVAISGDYDYWITARSCGTEVPICMMWGFGNVRDFDVIFNNIDYTTADIMAFNYRPTVYVIQTSYNSSVGFPVLAGLHPLQQWDKVMEYPRENAYWIDTMCVKSEVYVNPPSGFKTR